MIKSISSGDKSRRDAMIDLYRNTELVRDRRWKGESMRLTISEHEFARASRGVKREFAFGSGYESVEAIVDVAWITSVKTSITYRKSQRKLMERMYCS